MKTFCLCMILQDLSLLAALAKLTQDVLNHQPPVIARGIVQSFWGRGELEREKYFSELDLKSYRKYNINEQNLLALHSVYYCL